MKDMECCCCCCWGRVGCLSWDDWWGFLIILAPDFVVVGLHLCVPGLLLCCLLVPSLQKKQFLCMYTILCNYTKSNQLNVPTLFSVTTLNQINFYVPTLFSVTTPNQLNCTNTILCNYTKLNQLHRTFHSYMTEILPI